MSTSSLAAQSKGAQDAAELSATLIRARLIAAIAGPTLIAVHRPPFALAFQIVPASPQVESKALTFLKICIWSAPPSASMP